MFHAGVILRAGAGKIIRGKSGKRGRDQPTGEADAAERVGRQLRQQVGFLIGRLPAGDIDAHLDNARGPATFIAQQQHQPRPVADFAQFHGGGKNLAHGHAGLLGHELHDFRSGIRLKPDAFKKIRRRRGQQHRQQSAPDFCLPPLGGIQVQSRARHRRAPGQQKKGPAFPAHQPPLKSHRLTRLAGAGKQSFDDGANGFGHGLSPPTRRRW